MSSWIDMWVGQWTGIWGVQVPDLTQRQNYYNVQVEIYRDTDINSLVDIINGRFHPNCLSEIRGHGAGSFKVSKRDAKILKDPTLIDYRNYVKIRLNGMVIGGFIIQTKKTVIVGAGEEADEMWELSGEGPRSWVRDASIYPSKGLTLQSSETRYFNFATEQGSWYNATDWPYAVMRWQYNNVSNGAPKGHAPANWPDAPLARWIWNNAYSGTDPQGYVYFRHEFTVTGTPGVLQKYAFFIAADDAAEVYLNGEQKAVLEISSWQDTTRVEFELYPGNHVIGVKAYNMGSGAPGEILTALFSYGDPNVPSSAVLKNHSGMANTWRCQAYPVKEPGWTIGDIILTLMDEAKARGIRFANNFTPMFSRLMDSSGASWGDPIPMSFGVGSTYEEMISALEELGCDVWVDPDNLNFYAWKRRGTDRSLTGLMNGSLIELRRNLLYNPFFKGTATGGVAQNYTSYIQGSATGSFAQVAGGQQITVTALPTPVTSRLGVWTTPPNFATPYPTGSVVSLAASATGIGTLPANVKARLYVDLYDSAGSAYRGNANGFWTADGELRLSVTSTGPFNNIKYYIWLEASGSAFSGSTSVVFSGASAEVGTSGPAFSGDTPTVPANLDRFRWVGPQYNSASIREVPANYGGVVIFSPGHNLVGAEETGQAEIANTLMLRSAEGWSEATATDPTSVSKYGRVETQMSTQLTKTASASLIQEVFKQKALPEVSATFDIVPTLGTIPFIDFNVGDWVSAPGSAPGSMDSRRVMSIAFTEDDKTGLPMYALEFDTIFRDRQTELEKWLSRISNSSSIGGSFSNSGWLPPTVTPTPPSNVMGAIPDPPTGLAVNSTGKYLPDGNSSSDFALTWNPVVTGTGFGSLEINQYEVWGRVSTSSDSKLLTIVFDTFANLPGFRPGDNWLFKVRAVSRTGGPGNFGAEVAKVAAAPVTPLGKPSKPVLTSSFGAVAIKWDGLLGGSAAPPYMSFVRVERSTAATGQPWTGIGSLVSLTTTDFPGAAGTTWWYRFVAVDRYGNSSVPSDPETVTVSGVNSGDITGGLASNNLVGNGSFEDGFTGWTVIRKHASATVNVVSTGSFAGAKYLQLVRGTEAPGSEVETTVGQATANLIPISSVGSSGYFISAKASSSGSVSQAFSARVYWFLADKVTPASVVVSSVVENQNLSSTAAYFSGQVFPPADARYMQVAVANARPSSTIFVDDIIAREIISSTMVGSNAITATHMSAGSVSANALQAGSVTADAISAGAIIADKLAVGAIQVSHLSPSVGSSLDISANSSVNILVNRTNQIAGDLDSTNNTVEQLTTYYSFGPDGAIIGQTDSAFKLYLKNDRIEILENGIVVSYWDSGRMVVPSFVGEEVVLGNHKLEKYTTGTIVKAI